MLKSRKIIFVICALLLAAFLGGLVRLFHLRLDHGDVYPAYSSLRSDPLGSKAFYQSVEQLPGISARRLYQSLEEKNCSTNQTLFVLGVSVANLRYIPDSDFRELQSFLYGGGRLVISLFPEAREVKWTFGSRSKKAAKDKEKADPSKKKPEKSEGKSKTDDKVKTDDKAKPSDKDLAKKKDDSEKKNDHKPGQDEDSELLAVSLLEKLGVKCKYEDLLVDTDGSVRSEMARVALTNAALPKSLSWHSAIYFAELNETWRPIYKRGKNPVLIERSFGRGSVVLSADSYFLSNEALRKERCSDLLVWVIGPSRELLFDETHFGVAEDPGIAALARKYGLGGVVVGLIALAGLFIWKNGSSFLPPADDFINENRRELVMGKDAASGFVNLLRRNISQGDILSVCFAEWKKTCGRGGGGGAGKVQAMEQIVAEQNARSAASRQPVESYRALAKILNQRK